MDVRWGYSVGETGRGLVRCGVVWLALDVWLDV